MLFQSLPLQVSDALIRRVMSRVRVNRRTGCWIVAGATDTNGYGRVRDGRREHLAHRLLYLHEFGGIPDGLHVLHRCDNRRCCRPDHLFEGDAADNVADRIAKGRPGGRVPKLSGRQVAFILRSDRSLRELAKRYGVTLGTIRYWRHKAALPRLVPSHRVRGSRQSATLALPGQLSLF